MTRSHRMLAGSCLVAAAFALFAAPTAGAEPGPFAAAAAASAIPAVSFSGTWVDVNPLGKGALHFEDGRVTGTDGCNRVFGGFRVEGNVAHLDALASTMMACPDMGAQWIGGTATLDHVGVVLVARDQRGAIIGALRPALPNETA